MRQVLMMTLAGLVTKRKRGCAAGHCPLRTEMHVIAIAQGRRNVKEYRLRLSRNRD
jgi:hypothetical protein